MTKTIKIINSLLIGFLLIGCANNKTITEFERILGKENSKTLTYLVQDFENDFLADEYPNLATDESYERFLEELIDGNGRVWQEISNESRERFAKSTLKYEIYSVPDSVWIERDTNKLELSYSNIPMVKTRLKVLIPDGTFEYNFSESSFNYKEPIDEDSIIKQYMNYVNVNYVGSYVRALNSIPNKSRFLVNYLNIRDAAGIISPVIIASRMLDSKVDFNDYFIRRLIVTEIAY
ncbi:hypothetical protein ULMA_31360 [Patiriisocius marinus]|uniref:Lipoprotein n=1 Tax=Patiriisocius marinus TaxID=1397112 RepID=A0A5J4J4S8_9FLAO|nr:hypothetical protein [Patiriisocius marinus]GER61028.1 hypothetical protein ULMA_31360 [Patiriisocius marinus]